MLENSFQNELLEAGCDEAGRGCLAGSVFAAAVILACLVRVTLTSGSASAGAFLVFTSTICSSLSFKLMISSSRCEFLQFLSMILCPCSIKYEQAFSSPIFPVVCLESVIV